MTTTAAPRFCFACGAALPAGARFCSQCGQSMATVVPGDAPGTPDAAGVVRTVSTAPPATSDRARGANAPAPVDGLAPPPAPASASANATVAEAPGERRQVAVLFADLAGFTRLSTRLDPEEVHRLLGRYFDAVDRIVEAYGGRIDKHIGDAVMGVFGAPVAHGNDAERAVRAACDIHRAMERLAAESGEALAAHIGVASGEVVAAGTGSAAHSEYTVTGDAVNLASRLDGLASGGETLISGQVWRSVSARIRADPVGRVEVRGLGEPVEVWRVTGLCDPLDEQLPLVGRRSEIRQFQAVLASAAESGRGGVVVLRGEAGIGKTRLAARFREMASAAGFATHTGLVLDFGAPRERGAVAEIAARLLGADERAAATGDDERDAATGDDELPARERALAGALASWLPRPDDEPFLRDLLWLPQPPALQKAYEAMDEATRTQGRLNALRALAKASAGVRPRLTVVEDTHWADPFTLACLAALARAAAEAQLVLLATTRVEGDRLDARWRSRIGGAPLLTLDLGPLPEADALELARSVAVAGDGLIRSCVERAEGNPLFIVQLLHAAGETAVVPASIQSLVLSRIDRLSAADKAAVQAASVIGQRFGLSPLRELVGDPGYACDALIDHHLVRPEGEGYLFAHALICDGAYASLLHSRRRELHRRAAGWFARRDPQLCAEHLDRADDPGAAQAYLDAARALAEALRLDRAIMLAERAAAKAADATLRHQAVMLRAELLRDAGHTEASIAAFADAAAAAEDDAGRCRAWIGVAAGQRLAGRPGEAMEALARAEPLATSLALTLERAVIHHTRGNLHFARGEVAECLAQHQAALRAARDAGDAQAEANARSGIGDARYAQGRMREAFGEFSACVALAREHGLVRVEVPNLCMMGHSRSFLFELDQSLADFRAAAELARRIRQPHLDMFVQESFAVVHLRRGEQQECEQAAHAALALARRLASARYEAILLLVLATLAMERREPLPAREFAEQALAIVRERHIEGFIGPPILALTAHCADDAATATRLLDDGEAMLARGAVGHCHLWFHQEAGDAAIRFGDWPRALHHADALEEFSRADPLPWSAFHAARARALVASARGERSPALASELRSLLQRARDAGLHSGVPALEAALAS